MPKPAPCIDEMVCLRCDPCPAQKACRVRALIRFEPEDAPFVDRARCMGCVRCVVACPYSAVRPPGHCHAEPRSESYPR